MRTYPITLSNGDTINVSHIGINHTASGITISNNASTYNREFDNNDEVCIDADANSIRYCIIGDIKEAYQILRNEIFAKKPQSIYEYTLCIENTIVRCFGDFSKSKNRLFSFPTEKDVISGKKNIGKVSDLFHKNMAFGVERAMLAQNLLIETGIKSTFKASSTIVNDKLINHAYNLISQDGKFYIFDATFPSIINDKVCPLICEIPEEVYNKISNPNSDIGISVNVTHFNPLQNMEYNITYDAEREEVYNKGKTYTK